MRALAGMVCLRHLDARRGLRGRDRAAAGARKSWSGRKAEDEGDNAKGSDHRWLPLRPERASTLDDFRAGLKPAFDNLQCLPTWPKGADGM